MDAAQVWAWLAEVEDPEIPALSIVDLGIVRDVACPEGGPCTVTLTPTYSGCPATEVIAASVREHLRARGVTDLRLDTRLAPAWTTDWLSEAGKRKLLAYGIAPPLPRTAAVPLAAIGRGAPATPPATPACPQCGSARTQVVSAFGSTPCKSMYRCMQCSEPFDHFKCH